MLTVRVVWKIFDKDTCTFKYAEDKFTKVDHTSVKPEHTEIYLDDRVVDVPHFNLEEMIIQEV